MWLIDSIKDFFRRGDLLLLGLCLAASGYGLAMIYSATRYMGSLSNVRTQIIAIILGIGLYIACSFIDIDLFLEKGWKLLLAFYVVMFVALELFGYGEEVGNKNWIKIPGIPMSIQPAELIKIAFILLLAFQFSKLKERRTLSDISSVTQLLIHGVLVIGALFYISNDAGMCIAYLFIFIVMAWMSGLKLRWFALGFSLIGSGCFVVYRFFWDKVPAYMRNRIAVVFDHDLDPLGVAYQQRRGILALGSGQFWGQGYLNGMQSQSSSGLIHRETDFILAVIGEELGMVGCLLVFALIVAIVLRCLYVSRVARTECSSLICVGVAAMLIIQTIINVGMVLFVLPTIGLTLPFFSYGGSSIISLFAAMGFVSSVKMRSLPSWLKDRSQT